MKVPACLASAWLTANCFHLVSLLSEGQRAVLKEEDAATISPLGPQLARFPTPVIVVPNYSVVTAVTRRTISVSDNNRGDSSIGKILGRGS